MDPLYGRGFQYNNNNILNEELFDYGYEMDPNYRLMNQPEIPVEPPQDDYRNDYPSSNHQQMHQMYHDNVRYGNDGYHSPRHGSNYPYAPQRTAFDYNQQTEYPSYRISADIRLSRRGIHRQSPANRTPARGFKLRSSRQRRNRFRLPSRRRRGWVFGVGQGNLG